MHLKRFFVVVMSLLLCIVSLCSCGEEEPVPELKYNTQYPTSAAEYNLLINQKITPMLNVAEGHMTKGKDIIANKYPIDEELISVEDSLIYLREIYESCKLIMPPDSEYDRHSNTLMQMQRLINSIEVYEEFLEKANDGNVEDFTEDIQGSVDIIMSECTSLKNMFNLIA